MRLVSIGISSTVASRMMPVSPMPPTVAQKISASASGVTTLSPDGVASLIERTKRPSEPSTW